MRENFECCAVYFDGHGFVNGYYSSGIGEWDTFYGIHSPRSSVVTYGEWDSIEYFNWTDRVI